MNQEKLEGQTYLFKKGKYGNAKKKDLMYFWSQGQSERWKIDDFPAEGPTQVQVFQYMILRG